MSVPSPCQKICRLDPLGRMCVACFRTLDEIGDWWEMDDEAKRKTIAECERRRREQPGRV
jgi:hypothetical protein